MAKIFRKILVVFLVTALSINLTPYDVQAASNQLLTIKKVSFVADTLNGVTSIYRPGSSGIDGRNVLYSCAAFVKKYYKEVYGVMAYNFFYNKKPLAFGNDTFVAANTPRIGDIVACSTGRQTTHWAIVKEVNPDNTVTLIEQNWKWLQNGRTVTKINRTVKADTVKFYRLLREDVKEVIEVVEEEQVEQN